MGMNKYENKEATKKLKETFGGSVKLPTDVQFILEENDRNCRIKLDPQKVQTENMQANANAFEAWAVALYIALSESGIIILDVDGEFAQIDYEQNGHWGRFLYRALRFSEQYEWFQLSDKVRVMVDDFKEFLGREFFTNNLAEGEAGIKEKHNNENVIEAKLAEDEEIQKKFDFFAGNKVYRQLPVGLFKVVEDVSEEGKTYKYSKETMIFTGGKSAIDLWTWNEDEFEVIELKTKNIMMGIITEIFFYTNYMYDFLVRREGFILNKPSDKSENDRGYNTIYKFGEKKSIKKVRGIMLADEYHPVLENDRVLEVLNSNMVDIKYMQAGYTYGLTIDSQSNNCF